MPVWVPRFWRALGQQHNDALQGPTRLVMKSNTEPVSETLLSALGSATPMPGQLAPADSLKKLETLRQSVETLTTYKREGAPWSMRWGLYAGDELLPVARKLYCRATQSANQRAMTLL